MVRVKIISNPYKKEIQFEKYEEQEKHWKSISYQDNGNSNLISDKTSQSFLTFKIKEILDTIIEEYDDGEVFSIIFEGTDDEYKEIEYLMKEEEYLSLTLSKGNQFLENARDVLPSVTEIFDKTISILPEKMIGDNDILKFKESSSKIVPLIVLGNYSSGKSTFINALIGNEILPNSDSPLTANVFEIKQSKDNSASKINFLLNNEEIEIKIGQNHYEVTLGENYIIDLVEMIQNELSKIDVLNQTRILHVILDLINQCNIENQEFNLSDLISLEVPFNKGILSKSEHDYVIFDTPGSNSSSNKNHFEILKKALRNMSNGLTIFVSELDQLDAVDSENLYEELHRIEEIDSRFSLIIINKADTASLEGLQIQQILEQSIPRNLYSEGIFFVSSIMGLGSKIDGNFFNTNYDRIYKRSLDEFENISSEYYQKLYEHNIVPSQLKDRNVRESKDSNYPLLYINSGLLSIEAEIETFASKYSAYNKCQQTNLYLSKIIDKSNLALVELKASTQHELQALENELEKNKLDLIENVHLCRVEHNTNFENDYNQLLRDMKSMEEPAVTFPFLEELCEKYYNRAKEEFQLSKYKDLSDRKNKKLWNNVLDNLQSLPNELNISSVQNGWEQLQNDLKDQSTGVSEYKKQRSIVLNLVSQKLIQYSKDSYQTEVLKMKEMLFTSSVNFWEGHSNELKKYFATVIGAADGLPLEKREDIKQLIFDYGQIQLDNNDNKIFIKDNFKLGIQIGEIQLFGDKNKINLKKLSNKYDQTIKKEISQLAQQIRASHLTNFQEWTNSLVDVIKTNIIDFSPNLQKTNKRIIEKNQQIEDYEMKLSQLKTYEQEVISFLDWKKSN